MKLFERDGSSDDNNEDISKIEIDKDFARRYEHNKKREDLQRLQELKNKGIIVSDDSSETSSSSEEEEAEDDDVGHSTQHDLQFFDALLRVKKQDPSLKLKDTKLFHSEEGSGSDDGDEEAGNKDTRDKKKKKEKKKPMYLKDVVAKQLIETGPEFEVGMENRPKSYADEQEELRKEFLDAAAQAEDSGDDGEFLKVKKKNEEEEEDGTVDEEFRKKLEEYFGKEEELDENAAFLRDYFENRMWVDKGKEEEELDPDDLAGFSEDEEAMEKQEDYEREYNFRYEEDAGDQVLGHSRFVEGTVRKKPSARTSQRQRKKERMQLAELEKQEELKHLKKIKREEIIEKRNKIKEIAGISGNAACAFDDSDLEDEFDPEKFEKKMKDMFGDDYYNAEDADPDFGRDVDEAYGNLEKPDFEKEELLRPPKDLDDCPSGKEFLAESERILKQKRGAETDDQKDEQGVEKKLGKELNDEEMEEIYKLDYEDTIGDLKTRFKYAKVKSNRFGLKPEELLLLDDRELNQYVSLKKIAPYRDHEWKVPNSKRYEQKKRNRLLLEERMLNDQKAAKKKKLKGKDKRPSSKMVSLEDGKAISQGTNGDGEDSSKKSKKRRCREEFKLSASRLYAYGKIPPKPKNKSKAKDKAKH